MLANSLIYDELKKSFLLHYLTYFSYLLFIFNILDFNLIYRKICVITDLFGFAGVLFQINLTKFILK